MSEPALAQLILLRHGDVASHRGDVPITGAGLAAALRAGKAIGFTYTEPITLLYGGTRRTRQTAEALAEGIGDPARVAGPSDAFALRNPDVYVAGVRVDMVSSAAALAEQVPGLSEEDAAANEFFAEFMPSTDRIGWWLRHPAPPGDTAASLADRMAAFARSLADPGPMRGRLVVGVTHSPLLRAMSRRGGDDDSDPRYVTGVRVLVSPDRSLQISSYDPIDDGGRETTECRS